MPSYGNTSKLNKKFAQNVLELIFKASLFKLIKNDQYKLSFFFFFFWGGWGVDQNMIQIMISRKNNINKMETVVLLTLDYCN